MNKDTLKTLKLASAVACAGLLISPGALAASGTWTNNNSANWSATTSWLSGTIADGAGNTADFSTINITDNRTVTLDTSRTIGTLKFGDATTQSHDWTLGVANNAVLTLSGTPTINVVNRTATINPVLAGAGGFARTGTGTLQINNYNNTFSGNVTISGAAQTRIRADGSLGQVPGTPTADAITLSGGAVLMNYETDVVLAANRGITLGTGGGKLQAGWSRALTINSPIVGIDGLTINNDTTPGLTSLNVANSYSGPTAVNGWLQVNGSLDGGGAVTVGNGGLLIGNGTINAPVTVNAGGSLGAGGLFAAGTLTVNSSATLNGCQIVADMTPSTAGVNDLLAINGDLNLSGTITVLVTALGGTLEAGTYRLITYTGTLTGGAGNLVAAPSRYTISFDTTTTPGAVNMIVAGGPPASLVWKGDNQFNIWDLATPNWMNGASTDSFRNGDSVLFDNTGGSIVQVYANSPYLANTVIPGSVTVDANKDYTLGGGRLGGPMSLTKRGTGLLTLNAGNVNLPNYFDGSIVVEAGRVKPAYQRALGSSAGGVIVRNGASLDVNGQDLGFEPITIEGAGADGAGALVNYGGGQNNALRTVTMTGNATVGGTGRFDIRNVGGNASLSTGGNPFKLTKKGPNQFSLVGVAVDDALGDIDVQEGAFGFETTSTLGDPAGTLNMGFNTSLILWNLVNPFYKPLILGGGTAQNINNGAGASTIGGPVTILSQSVWNVGGTSLRVSSDITGIGGLTKVGGQPLYLDVANSYFGPTIISGGSVVLGAAASISNSPSITVATGTTFDVSAVAAAAASGAFELNGAIGQTLSGSGTVVGSVSAGKSTTVVAGTSAGTLIFNGNLTLDDGASAVFELGATTSAGAGANDLIVVSNNITLNGVVTLRIHALAPLDIVNPYTIAIYSGALNAGTATINVVSDSRYAFTVDPTSAPGTIRIWAAPIGVGAESLAWQGNVLGSETLWDIKTTANWSNSAALPDLFFLGDRVKFDDTAVGTTASLVGTVTPATLRSRTQPRTSPGQAQASSAALRGS